MIGQVQEQVGVPVFCQVETVGAIVVGAIASAAGGLATGDGVRGVATTGTGTGTGAGGTVATVGVMVGGGVEVAVEVSGGT